MYILMGAARSAASTVQVLVHPSMRSARVSLGGDMTRFAGFEITLYKGEPPRGLSGPCRGVMASITDDDIVASDTGAHGLDKIDEEFVSRSTPSNHNSRRIQKPHPQGVTTPCRRSVMMELWRIQVRGSKQLRPEILTEQGDNMWFGGIIGLIIWIVIAFWPARVAGRKGHSFIGFFLLSLLFFPLALIMAYVVRDRGALSLA